MDDPSCSSSSSLSASSSYSNPSCFLVSLVNQPANGRSDGSSQELAEQSWYWGSASKEMISAAMEKQRNGTFAVRDATTKGQYTLTLRIDDTNKLIKILMENDRCGFTFDSLDFDSIPDLIKFYRTCSLRDFNERLDTCLLHPLVSPEWQSKCGNTDKIDSKRELTHRLGILKCVLEGLHAEYDRVSRRYDHLFGQRTALSEEHKRKLKTAAAYSDALKIFERKIDELRRTISEDKELLERDREAMAMNVELQEERMEEIGKAQILMQTAIQNIGRTLIKIEEELDELKPRLLKSHKKRDKCRDKLLASSQQQVTHAQLDRIIQNVSLALDSEPTSLSTALLRTQLPLPEWHPENWLWHQGTKEQALLFIKSLPEQRNGLFLIRPSSSRQGFFALEIFKEGNVHSCLIEWRDPRATVDHCGGYGFVQTQMLFPSLTDFVRYYSMVSLKEHNSLLDTPLTSPALYVLKQEQRRKKKKMEEANERKQMDNDQLDRLLHLNSPFPPIDLLVLSNIEEKDKDSEQC